MGNLIQSRPPAHIRSKANEYLTKAVIPLKLFQTWHTLDLPPNMKQNVKRLQRENPEFEYFLYDDKMCRKFIKEHFHEEVVFAFDKLKPGAYKADLWRYCVLYIHGGIYLDINFREKIRKRQNIS
jgi:mannosyltransferase OCH1-like enzyme